jgi:hypothetical protein
VGPHRQLGKTEGSAMHVNLNGMSLRAHGPSRRRGSVMVYTVIVMPVLLVLCALSVDWGRVQMAKVEMVRACDAAARYAVTGATNGTAFIKANTIGGANAVDGQAVTFPAADVEVGRWVTSTQMFVPGGTPYNAVRITGRRTIPTIFAGAFGGAGKTVTVQAIAKKNAFGFGLVGLDSIYFGGNATASYYSTTGATGTQGNIASNGSITINGSSSVGGDAYYGPGGGVYGGSVSGTKTMLDSPLSYPNGDASPYGPSNNDNNVIPNTAMSGSSFNLGNNKHITLPGGNYYFNNFSTNGNASVTFTGPATIYCYGTFDMQGTTNTAGSIPGSLNIVMVPNPWSGLAPGSLTIGSNVNLYATIYAPQSAISLSGNGDMYGSVLGKSVSVTGSASVFYDMALESDNGAISLVK